METSVKLDEGLVSEAVRLGGHRMKEEAVTQALGSYVGHLMRLQILEHFGTIDFDPDYDYKSSAATIVVFRGEHRGCFVPKARIVG